MLNHFQIEVVSVWRSTFFLGNVESHLKNETFINLGFKIILKEMVATGYHVENPKLVLLFVQLVTFQLF